MHDAEAAPGHVLEDLVARFGGTLEGDGTRRVRTLATLTDAGPGALSFLANPRYRGALATTRAAAVLLSPAAAAQAGTRGADGPAFWLAADPYLTFARVAQHFYAASAPRFAPGVAPGAVVDPTAQVDPSAHIGAHAIIGAGASVGARAVIGAASIIGAGVSIGADALFHPRVTVYPHCVIGARAIVHSGVVIGADGFGFARDGHVWVKIPQIGRVVIGDDVEIGANTTIDRGALDDTVIGHGVKMDNQIQIGHNVRIGDHTAMAGCSAVAGSATIGARCQIGGAAMILGHLELGDDVAISVGTVISHSMLKPGLYTGFFPVSENARWEKNAALVRHLDTLRERVRTLEKQLAKDEGRA